MTRPRTAARLALVAVGALIAGAFTGAGPASAHVTVNPTGEAVQGGYTRVAFRVPNESDTATTTKLEVVLPEQTPIPSVSTMPVPGWTVVVEKGAPATPVKAHGTDVTEVVKKLTWTATGDAAVKAGQFMEFPVSLGPLPAAPQVVFKALQTYSDGTVVRWIEEPPANGGEEPERPAPVLKLAAAPAAAATAAAPAAPAAPARSSGGAALGLAIAGLVAGLAGLALGGLAFARTRKPAA